MLYIVGKLKNEMKTLRIITSIPFILTAIGIWFIQYQGIIENYNIIAPIMVDAFMVVWLWIVWRKQN